MVKILTLREYLRIPYILEVSAHQLSNGDWIRRARYPELPGCEAEAYIIYDAIEKLEESRVNCILRLWECSEAIPVPREPLKSTEPSFLLRKMGLNRWIELLD